MSQRGGGGNQRGRGTGGGRPQQGAQRKRGGPPPGFGTAPSVTKRDIEQQQQQLKHDQERQMEEEIQRRDVEKRGSGVSVETSSSYVKGSTPGQLTRVADLSAHWLDPTLQLPPFLPQDNLSLTEERLAGSQAVLEVLDADLSRLLRQKYHVFWSHVIFDPRLLRLIDSFLRYARRAFDGNGGDAGSSPALDPQSTYFSVFVKVLKVLLRMSTNRESATDFMDAWYFADLVYDKWIFDVPKIFDICTLYGSYNAKEVNRLVSSLLNLQPKYKDDLKQAVPIISRVEVERRLQQLIKEAGPQGRTFDDEDQVDQLCDVEYYLQDILATLYAFLRIHPESAALFKEGLDVALLAQLYDQVLPHLFRITVPPGQQARRQAYLQRAKSYLVAVGYTLLQQYYVEPLLHGTGSNGQADRKGKQRDDGKGKGKDNHGLADQLLNLLQALTGTEGETTFIRDIGFNFPLLETLESVRSKLDATRFDWVVAIIQSLCGLSVATPAAASAQPSSAASAAFEVDASRASLITQVRDLFPELGEGFIAACLHYFEDSAEAVIDALLTNALPTALTSLKRNMPLPAKPVVAAATAARPAQAQAAAAQPAQPAQPERRNIFDDEDLSNVRVLHGKKKQVGALKLMAQKSEVKQLRRTYEQYEYEDEYDDSYDTFQAVGDADGEGLDPIQPNPNRPTLRQRDADDANDNDESSAAKAAGEGNNENEDDNEDDDDDGSTQQRRRPGLAPGRAPVAGRGRGSVGRGKQPPAAAPSSASRGGGAAGRGAGAGGGRGRGRGGRGRGGPAGDDMSDRQKLLKDRHKSRLANHDRKQRALKKKGTTLPPPM